MNTPTTLRMSPQWVCWDGRWRDDGSTSKVPVNAASGRAVDPHDPAHWLTFEHASEQAARHRRSGVGYVVTSADPFVCIDLDHAIDSDTNQMTLEAASLVRWFSSYTERSPSGQGLHIWVRGKLPAGHRCKETINGQRVEVYTVRRYLTVTGDHVAETPATIETRQLELSMLAQMMRPERSPSTGSVPRTRTERTQDERTILERARREPWFDALYRGDLTARNGDHNGDDQAACNRLANCGATPEQIDSIIRSSGLMRDKWDEVHYADGQTYGEHTINKAFDRVPRLSTSAPQQSGGERCAVRLVALSAQVDQLTTERDELRTVNTLLVQTATNPHLQGRAATIIRGVARYHAAKERGETDADGFARMTLTSIGDDYNNVAKPLASGATVARHLNAFEQAGLMQLEKRSEPVTTTNPNTGERLTTIIPNVTWAKFTGETFAEMLQPFATFQPVSTDEPKPAHGGDRRSERARAEQQARRTPCPECGSTERHTYCGGCGSNISATVEAEEVVFQDEIAALCRADVPLVFQDENNRTLTHRGVWGNLSFQDEKRGGSAPKSQLDTLRQSLVSRTADNSRSTRYSGYTPSEQRPAARSHPSSLWVAWVHPETSYGRVSALGAISLLARSWC